MDRAQVRRYLCDLYDDYRTVALNQRYYACHLAMVRRINLASEVIIAAGTSAAVGAWASDADLTVWWWRLVAGIAVVLAVVKPFMNLSGIVERYSKLWTGYTDLYLVITEQIRAIRRVETVPAGVEREIDVAKDRLHRLSLEDDARPSKWLVRRCVREVNQEIPPASLWLPALERTLEVEDDARERATT